MNFTILRFEKLSSTNDEAIRQARLGAQEGLCIVAEQQTHGRGRYGRKWFSPPNAGLYFSLILRPRIEISKLPLVTLMSAIAVHDTLENLYFIDCDIKWVNDIQVNKKKICGILTETTETEIGQAVVVGIGINLTIDSILPEISDTATSIEHETNVKPNKDDLIYALTNNLDKFYCLLQDKQGDEKICSEWTSRSSYAFNKLVRVKTGGKTIEGVTHGIEKNGALILKLSSGDFQTVAAGDLEELRPIQT